MADSSILHQDNPVVVPPGHDIDSLGPSDSSDNGSDVQGERTYGGADPASEGALTAPHGSDTDRSGTGERGSAVGDPGEESPDIRPDRVIGAGGDDEALLDDIDAMAADDSAEEDDDVDGLGDGEESRGAGRDGARRR